MSAAAPLRILSSMATRSMLTDLLPPWQGEGGVELVLESVGGVRAAERIQGGESFDIVVLAQDALQKLCTAGWLQERSVVPLVHSAVAAAVRAGAPVPDFGSAAAVEAAVRAAPSIGYSTGPSGVALARLFTAWGLDAALQGRVVIPPPGVPVGALVARGEVALGFQQRAELIHLDGIGIVGDLPADIAIDTVFAAAIHRDALHRVHAGWLLQQWTSPRAWPIQARHGLRPALPANA